MVQDFVYDFGSALKVVRELGLGNMPKQDWRDRLFGRALFFDNLMGKSKHNSDVIYIKPFSGKVPFDFGHSLGEMGYPVLVLESAQWIDASGFSAYAVDPLMNVRKWGKKVFFGEKNAERVSTDFAREVADKYGKVAVLDSVSNNTKNELFSVYFPYVGEGSLGETISKSEGELAFRVDLGNALERAFKLCK